MDDPDSSFQLICPNCGAPLDSPAIDEYRPSVHCPYCEANFIPGAGEEADESQDAAVEWQEPAEPENELDGVRIRQVMQLRRSAIRARTYALVILICCLVMTVQLALTDLQEVHLYGWDHWAVLYAISAAALVIGSALASRKAAVFHHESNASSQIGSDHSPHFDALSNGSQQVKNLEIMVEDASDKV